MSRHLFGRKKAVETPTPTPASKGPIVKNLMPEAETPLLAGYKRRGKNSRVPLDTILSSTLGG